MAQRVVEFKAAEALAMTAMAVRDTKDDELDETVRGFFLALLEKVLNNRKSPLYLKYFPDGVSPILGAAPDDEIRAVGILLQRLADETDPALKLHAPALTQAVAGAGAQVGTALVAVATEPAGAGAVKTAVAGAGAQVGATAGVKPNAELATTVSNALAPAAASATA